MSKTKAHPHQEFYDYHGKKIPFKQWNVSQSSLQLLLFYAQEERIRMLEMQFWQSQATYVRQEIMKSAGINPDHVYVDWDALLTTGVFKYAELPEETVPEEAKVPVKVKSNE